MAHTPSFQRLLRARAVAAEASRRDISAEDAIEERLSRVINRRDFLALAAVCGGLAARGDVDRATGWLTPRGPSRQSAPTSRIATIGAGLAGLTCAIARVKPESARRSTRETIPSVDVALRAAASLPTGRSSSEAAS